VVSGMLCQDGQIDGGVFMSVQPGMYSAGFAPVRRRRQHPGVGGVVRWTHFGLDLLICQKTGWPQVTVMPPL